MIDTLLTTVKDKTDTDVTIFATSQLGMSPLCSIFMKEYGALMAAGRAWPRMTATNKTKAIHVQIDEKIVGFITYELSLEWGTCYIFFSWIDEKFRGRGIYKLMFAELEQLCRMSRCYKIHSDAHVDNVEIIEAHRAVGMQTVFYKNEKTIKP